MMRILVVEDEKLLCDGIAEDLELEKYTVERCYDGAEAYDLLLSESFDLLILDLNLPGMDGLDLLRAVRAEQPELRVLILSARAELSDRVAGLDLGGRRLSHETLCPGGTGGPSPQPDATGVCLPKYGTYFGWSHAGHICPCYLRRRKAAGADAQRVCHSGAPDAPPGPLGQSGGADGACAGVGRQPLQQCGPDAYLLPAEKTAGCSG